MSNQVCEVNQEQSSCIDWSFVDDAIKEGKGFVGFFLSVVVTKSFDPIFETFRTHELTEKDREKLEKIDEQANCAIGQMHRIMKLMGELLSVETWQLRDEDQHALGATLEELSGICDHLNSIRDGIQFALHRDLDKTKKVVLKLEKNIQAITRAKEMQTQLIELQTVKDTKKDEHIRLQRERIQHLEAQILKANGATVSKEEGAQ